MNNVERKLKQQHTRLDLRDRQRALNERHWRQGVESEDWIGEDGQRVKPKVQRPQQTRRRYRLI